VDVVHFRVVLDVELAEPVVLHQGERPVQFRRFSQSLGVNAESLAEAAAFAESFALQELPGSELVGADFLVLPESEIPDEVLSSALRDIEEAGVYWASGRIYGEFDPDEPAS
jgi:hypothetical protein